MPLPLCWKSKLLLVGIETTYGVDPTPASMVLAKNITINPMEGEDVDRDIERPFFGAQETFPANLRSTIEFDVELVGSGTVGMAPGFGPLLRAVGFDETVTADTSVVYTRISAAIESAAFYVHIAGNKQPFLGARGDATINLTAQQVPTIHFKMTGLWSAPVAAAVPAFDSSAYMPPQVATKTNTPTFTLDGVALVMRSFALALNNQVEPKLLVNRDAIFIVDMNEKITTQVEAVPLATFNPFTRAQTRTPFALALQHDSRAGYKVAIAAPKCQLMRPASYANQQNVVEWPLELRPLPTDAGNDQLTITFT
jgi:hypothetical protein